MTKEIIQKYNIDTSHFRAKTKIDDFPINEIIEKISKAKCYKEALCSFGYSGQPRDNKWIDFYANLYNINISHYSPHPYKDLKGCFFGELECLEIDKELTKIKNCTHWICKCHRCGNIKSVSLDCLNHGQKTCGCLKQSYEATKIQEYFNINHIKYFQEYTFDDLRGKKNIRLRFDFCIQKNDNNIFLIEYQGEQHFRETNDFWGGKEGFVQRQKYDQMKRDYCKEHNINLYEITYKEDTISKLKEILILEHLNLEN